MDPFFDRLIVRAATVDEILSSEFESIAGRKDDAELAGRRLAAWCHSCANGDWHLFASRLKRDGLNFGDVLSKFARVRRNPSAGLPVWVEDAIWIDAALSRKAQHISNDTDVQPVAFEHLFLEVVQQAEARLWRNIDAATFDTLAPSAHACVRHALLASLSNLAAPALFDRFEELRKTAKSAQRISASYYERFVTEMSGGGLRKLFEDKPVLLRLLAVTTRQWIDTWREFVLRAQADAAIVRHAIGSNTPSRIEHIKGGLSDPHNGGRSVHIIRFEDGSRVVYKPKDLRIDVAFQNLISTLNEADPPLSLRAVKALARDGYGWTEFIEHEGCSKPDGCKRFFERAGAWLALLHFFGGTDFHQENMIAAGAHPVPIDLETILQPTTHRQKSDDPEAQAYEAALEIISNSVCVVGMLPGFISLANEEMLPIGGMVPFRNFVTRVTWDSINSDDMRPTRATSPASVSPNLPHVAGQYSKLGDHRDEFVKGFRDYARYLTAKTRDGTLSDPFAAFAKLPVRRVLRATSFYYGLVQRLQNFRSMDDGIMWSAQADFVARFSNWDNEADPTWRLQDAERSALLLLNIPYFLTASDGQNLYDQTGALVSTQVISGIERARARLRNFDEKEINWQLAVIEENTKMLSHSPGHPKNHAVASGIPSVAGDGEATRKFFLAEASKIVEELTGYAIRRGPSAAWLGLDQRHSDVGRFVALGPDLYNGHGGIALFLAAHAAVTGQTSSGNLALAAVAHLRKNLRSRNAARMTRLLGIGGTAGLGSIIYALTAMSRSLRSNDLLEDAHAAAALLTDGLIEADRRLDIMHGSAGAILGLLSLYRHGGSPDILERAVKCGQHLLKQPRIEVDGHRSWVGQGVGKRPLNGMSHGAAGYAYALASLFAATGREEFSTAASECIAFENASFDAKRSNWPDWRDTVDHPWRSQWCHGATGIGLARLATMRRGVLDSSLLRRDVDNALGGAEQEWPNQIDTLCCGTLGHIELLSAAAKLTSRSDLLVIASGRLVDVINTASMNGNYRWHGSQRAFNLGLFLGLAGVGYTCLRQADLSVPNVLIWE